MSHFLLIFLGSLLLSGTAPLLPADAHDFHVSKCLVEYRESYQSLQITVHLFIDDLELALEKAGHSGLFIGTDQEADRADAAVEAYLRAHFLLTVDGKPVSYAWIGKEPADDYQGLWCYLEAAPLPKPSEMAVSNDLLMEVFDDQKNIVAYSFSEKEQGYLLFDKGHSRQSVRLE